LQTHPQSILGKWILHDVFGLQARELVASRSDPVLKAFYDKKRSKESII